MSQSQALRNVGFRLVIGNLSVTRYITKNLSVNRLQTMYHTSHLKILLMV